MPIIAVFSDDARYTRASGSPWQYDYGQTLEIRGLTGLPSSVQVHYAVQGTGTAERRIGAVTNDVLIAPIPDAMLAQAQSFFAYVYTTDGESGQTLRMAEIICTARPEPSDEITPAQQSAFDQLVATVNGLITAVGEVNETATASAGAAAVSAGSAANSATAAAESAAATAGAVSAHNASETAHDNRFAAKPDAFPNISVRRPLITFSSDDGYEADYNVLQPICAEYGIPMTFFVASRIGSRMTAAHMLELQNTYGCEIATHSRDHTDLTTLTEEQIEEQLSDSYDDLTALGLTIKNMAYPEGAHNPAVRRLAKKYYRCSASASVGYYKILTGAIPRMDIPRIQLGTLTDVGIPGYPTVDTLNYYKALVDGAVTYNGWLVFCMHGGNVNFTLEQQQILKDLIVYIQSLDVDIVTLDQGFDVFGSVEEFGDCTIDEKSKGIIATADGRVNPNIRIFTLGDTKGNSGVTAYTPIEAFPVNCRSYTPIYSDATNGFPLNAGTVVTDKTFNTADGWYQEFHANTDARAWLRRYNSSLIPGNFQAIVALGGSSGSRPYFGPIGVAYFDTTLGKPVFCKTVGISEINTITVTAGAASSGNVTIHLGNGSNVVVALTAGDTTYGVAAKIAAAFVGVAGYSAYHVNWATTVRITDAYAAARSTATFTDTGGTGATATVAKTRTGVASAFVDATGTTV